MTIAILVAAFSILILLGVPVSFAIGISSLFVVLYDGHIPLNLIVHRTVLGIDSFVLLAIPLFIFAGTVMEQGGISDRLVHFARTITGRFRGGLPMAVVLGTMMQSGVSGSMVADVSAVSSMTLAPLRRAGYSKAYSLSVISASSAFAILIPPCILMVIVAAVANVSVMALFAAGLLPSAFLGALVIGLIHVQARFFGLPRDRSYSALDILRAAKDGALALGIPVVLFAGIRLGVATATEMAAIIAVYALLVGGLVYRKLTWRGLVHALVQTTIATGVITMLMGFATIFSYILATEGVPRQIANFMKMAEVPAWGVLVITALIFVFIGSVLEGAPAVLIFIPILLPQVSALDIDMVHWLTVVVLSSGLGAIVPPTGLAILIACSIGKIRMEKLILPIMPFLGVLLVGLVALIIWPGITTIVPRMLDLPY